MGKTVLECSSRWILGNAEVLGDALHGGIIAFSVQLGNEIDHIAVCKAAETVEIVVVQLHAGVMVIVKATAGQIIALDFHAVMGGSLRDTDCSFDGIVDSQLGITPWKWIDARSSESIVRGDKAIRLKTGAFARKIKKHHLFLQKCKMRWREFVGCFVIYGEYRKRGELPMQRIHEYLPGDCRERIQDLLRERKMTQTDLAQKTGISGSSLNRYISGETDKISAENIVKIARAFNVSTDFLLCETNIPYQTNYDIERLGLTAKAATRLYTGEVDPTVVSQLIEHKEFAVLVAQIAQFKDATIAAGIAGMNTMISHLSSLVQRVGKKNPKLQLAAIRTQQDIEARKMPEGQTDTTAMEATFLRIVKDLRDGADAYIAETQRLTSEAMVQLMQKLQKRGVKKLMDVTPEQLVDAALDTTDPNVITEQHRAVLREMMLPLLTKAEK